MPPKKRFAEAEEYDSDGGFVEDAPKSKRSKVSKEGRSKAAPGAGQKGKDGEVFWELSDKRRVGLQRYGGRTLINIREFYEKDGQMLPSKKGISLPVDQFNKLVKILPQIEAALTEKGEKVDRPGYDGAVISAAADNGDDNEEEVEPVKVKRNFDETSEEE